MGLPPKSTVFRNSCTVFAPEGRFQKFKMQTKAEFWARLVRTSISSNSRSAKFYIETTCGRMGFQHFSSNHFFFGNRLWKATQTDSWTSPCESELIQGISWGLSYSDHPQVVCGKNCAIKKADPPLGQLTR